jgi:hypothetical protein
MSRARDNADLGDSYGSLGAGVTGGSGLTALASNPTVTLGSNATFPAGHVLQTLIARNTGPEVINTTTWTAIPDMSLAITPSATSSKILVSVNLQVAGNVDKYILAVRLYRGSASIGHADTEGSRPTAWMVSGAQVWHNYNTQSAVNFYLDSPNTTSATTYSLKIWDVRDNSYVMINRNGYNIDGVDSPRGTSSMVLQEIAG